MTTKTQKCAHCGEKQEISTTADLLFEICQGCDTMGEWGQEAAPIEAQIVDPTESELMLSEKFKSLTAMKLFETSTIEKVVSYVTKKAKAHTPDIKTDKGRKAIASNSAEVSRSKTFLEKIGKAKSAEIKKDAKTLDASRKYMKESLDELRDEMRQPLTDWEEDEKARVAAEELAEQIETARGEAIAEDDLFNRHREVERKEAKIMAEQEKQAAEKAERERIESERLAKEKEEKEQAARDEQIRKKAMEKEKLEAEQRAKAESERVEREKQEEATKLADAKRRIEEEKASKAAAITLAQKEERERIEREQAAKEESERIEREAADKKAANKAHRAKIKEEAVKFIVGIEGVTGKQAEAIFDAISFGDVPHITVGY